VKRDSGQRLPRSFTFGPFVLIPERQLLLKEGTPVRIGSRALEILTALVERAGEVVTKRELFSRVWPETIVEDGNLKVNVAALRRSLDEESGTTRYIVAVSGRGYRFVIPVQAFDSMDPSFTSTAATTRHYKLPPSIARIIGRTAAILAIRRALGDSRLVSIVGAGGIGKTTVAVAAAREVEDAGLATVAFIDLSRVASEEFVPASLLAALGIHSGSQDSLQAVVSILARRKTLLLFDTCEHVLNAVARICNVLLSSTPDVRILATSRQVLGAHGERVEWLAPLEVPPAEHSFTAQELLQYSAPSLLEHRAFEKTAYRLTDADAPAVAEICRRLDGAPLAIELVASRLAGRSANVVLHELEDRFRTLRRDSPGGPLRQQTLLATLEWSYALLTESEATVFRAISIFAGSFDIESVLGIIARHDLGPIVTSDAIAGLCAKSMLSVNQRAGEQRYCLLDSARAFAATLLDDQAELATVSASHARLQLDTLTRSGMDRATVVEHVEDLRKALSWAFSSAGDSLLGVKLVAAGLSLWNELSLGEESRRNCERALAEYARIGCTDQSLKLTLMVGLAALNTYLSKQPEQAIALYETAIQLARQIGDAAVECRALGALATYQLLPADDKGAWRTITAMRKAAIRAKDRFAYWEQELLRASCETHRSAYPAAGSRLERLRAEMRNHVGNGMLPFQTRQEIRIDSLGGVIHWLAGRPGEGLRLAQTAAREAIGSGHGLTLIYTLAVGVLFTVTECHEYEIAASYAQVLNDTVYRDGMAAWIPITNVFTETVATLSGTRNDPERLRAAFDDLRNGMFPHGLSKYSLLAKALIAIGQPRDAARIVDYVLDTFDQRSYVPEFLRIRAATQRALGRHDDAEQTLRKSLRLNTFGPSFRLRAATDLAGLLRDRGDCAQARQLLGPIYNLFTEGFDTGDLRNARGLLEKLA
jgi:predicted ATPase/DNA-binding winged helix-turn-helix (wHTH) protein